MKKIEVIVFDKSGKNVTNDRDWYINTLGDLCYFVKESKSIEKATSDYYYVISK